MADNPNTLSPQPAHKPSRYRRRIGAASVAVVLVAGLGACGDDSSNKPAAADPTTTTTAAPVGDVQAYCTVVAELDASGAMPTDAQMKELLRTAPPEIVEDVTLFVSRLRTAVDQDSFLADPDVAAALQHSNDFKAKNC